jgi:hypothetical protein
LQRDAQQRETLSQTIRTLRADSLRQTTDLERLSQKHAEAQRKLGIADASERALKQQIRSTEQAARGLKEGMGRMKLLVNQTRSQCANEVRKRERTIEGLKRHVGEGGRARGGGKPVGVVTVTVVPGVGVENCGGASVGVEDSAYDLRSETNEFLTELARGLSDENENMGTLLRRTVETLQTLSGCEKEGIQQEGGMVVQMESGYENLAAEMDVVIEHLRNLLTNPSFVPLEEVEVREEEIIRLREGWERMESRWRDAVNMMDGWRKRMARSGQTVNLEELKMGLMLSPLKPKDDENGQGMHMSTLMEEGEGDTQTDIDAMEDSGMPPPDPDFDEDLDYSDSCMFEDEPVDDEPEEVSEQQPEKHNMFNRATSASPGPAPQLSPLRETTGNRAPLHPNGPQKENFTTIVEENTYDLLQLDTSPPQKGKSARSTPQAKSTPTPMPQQNHKPQSSSHLSVPPEDEVSLLKTSSNTQSRPSPSTNQPRSRSSSPQKTSRPTSRQQNQREKVAATPKLRTDASSRLPRPREEREPIPQQSPLTMASIAAKLAATEREADAARVRAKIKAARMGRNSGSGASGNTEDKKLIPPLPARQEGEEKVPTKSRDAEMNGVEESEGRQRKRKASGRTQGGRASRRRSTLSPWELESLILGGMGAASPVKGADEELV